jgi:heat shock protein HslJ
MQMKKCIAPLLFITALVCGSEMMGQTKKVVTRRTRVNRVVVKQPEPEKTDTVETKIEVTQTSYKTALLGKWNLISMAKQQKEGPQKLDKGFYIVFKEDETFNGFSGCNSFSGTYNATGATLLLNNMVSTQMDCDKTGTEAWVLKNLTGKVKAFATMNNGNIALKDGTGNTVFECAKE